MGLRDKLAGRRAGSGKAAASEASRIKELVAAARAEAGNSWWSVDYAKTKAGEELLADPPERQAASVPALLRVGARGPYQGDYHGYVADALAARLLKRKLPLSDEQLVAAWEAVVGRDRRISADFGPVVSLIRATEMRTPEPPVAPALVPVLERVRDGLRMHGGAGERRAIVRIDVLLGADTDGPLGGSDPWSRALAAALDALPESDREAANEIIAVAAEHGTTNKPSKKFLAGRDELASRLGPERLGELVAPLIAAAARVPAKAEHGQTPPEVGDVLRGLATVAGHAAGAPSANALADLAIAGWRKVPGHGPQSRKAATAATAALGEHPDGAPQLGRIKVAVKQAAAREDTDRAIDAAAETLGIPRAEFEERVVPDMGLVDGAREETLGSHTARVAVDERLQIKLAFVNEAGRTLKSVPAEVKREHDARLRALKAEVKDAQAMFDAQRLRLERLLMDDPSWELEPWRERYAGHGLVGPLARRLIWRFGDASAVWHDGAWRGAGGERTEPASPVRLWHPADADAAEVQAWRAALEEWQITQPFKQAHREVYLLTDAERNTGSYSNRFAAHVLRQHQMAALARTRGWTYALQGAWDAPDEAARIALPQHGLTAYFFVDRPWDTDDFNETGVFNHVLTDQVRFQDRHDQALALEEIPRRVLSEILRDVDLFVGVASIGNDPAWQDRGADRRYDDYWTSYSFGDLTAGAEVRKDVLGRLLPKLKIADRARIDGRFLRVEGRLRTYKIHLGSGNILMEPNDQYLCIVPGGRDRAADRVFLPFEGDQVLAVILSKAFMLAEDDAISDTTITSQIGR